MLHNAQLSSWSPSASCYLLQMLLGVMGPSRTQGVNHFPWRNNNLEGIFFSKCAFPQTDFLTYKYKFGTQKGKQLGMEASANLPNFSLKIANSWHYFAIQILFIICCTHLYKLCILLQLYNLCWSDSEFSLWYIAQMPTHKPCGQFIWPQCFHCSLPH